MYDIVEYYVYTQNDVCLEIKSILKDNDYVLGLYELIHIRESVRKFPFLIKVYAYLLVIFLAMNNFDSIEFVCNLDYRVMSFVIFAFLASMIFIKDREKYNSSDALFLIGSVLFVGLSFNLITITRNYDIALFTGMFIGKNKLAPTISPNKTIEGFVGGALMGTFIATSFYVTVINQNCSLVLVIFITLFLSCIGQLGDLVFSSIKREYGMKDFSNLIPGHGGILDRFDSLIFVFLAFILVLGII